MSVLGSGACSSGQLGLGHEEGIYSNVNLTSIPRFTVNPRQIAAGHFHTAAVLQDGTLLTAGKNDDGQLGRSGGSRAWRAVEALGTTSIVAAAAGQSSTVVVSDRGACFAFGSGTRGQLGLGSDSVEASPSVPRLIRGLKDHAIVAVSAGSNHVIALSYSGAVFTWGDNMSGQLGDGQYVARHTPFLLEDLSHKGVVAIAAGSQHTAAVTAAHELYTFGANASGQLGLGHTESRLRPTLVPNSQKLGICDVVAGDFHTLARSVTGHGYACGSSQWGQCGLGERTVRVSSLREITLLQEHGDIVAFAAGRRHTVVAIKPRMESASPTLGIVRQTLVFAFGANNQHQLGIDPSHPAAQRSEVFAPVRLKNDAIHTCYQVHAGGDVTFLLMGQQEGGVPCPYATHSNLKIAHTDSFTSIPRTCRSSINMLSADVVGALLAEHDVTGLVKTVESYFSSLACTNASFIDFRLTHGPGHVPMVSMPAIRALYDSLVSADHPDIVSAMSRSLRSLMRAADMKSSKMTSPSDAYFLLLLLDCPLLLHSASHVSILEGVVKAIASLSRQTKTAEVLIEHYARAQPDFFVRAVQILENYLSYLLTASGSASEPLYLVCISLQLFFAGNAKYKLVPASIFYNQHVGVSSEQVQHMAAWCCQRTHEFSLCAFPFLVPPVAKANIIHATSSRQMMQSVAQAIFTGQGAACLVLVVDRSRIYEDTVSRLTKTPTHLWTAPLKVQFAGEEGVDEVGIIKEYFQLVLPKIYMRAFLPLESDGNRWFWFATPTEERLEAYYTMGLLLGLALYNRVLIEQLFPPVFYKMLVQSDIDLNLSDLASCSPDLAHGLQKLLDYDRGNEEEVFGLFFDMTVDPHAGAEGTVELKPGGSSIPVTRVNKEEYVHLYVRHFLYERCAASFDALKLGFTTIVRQTAASAMLRADELELLLCGAPEYKLLDLRHSARYVGYTDTCETIVWFWEVLSSFPQSLCRKFLLFLTGSARMPVGGAHDVVITVQRTSDVTRMPVAHTCYNLLDLPPYPSKEELAHKLTVALQETEGFNLV